MRKLSVLALLAACSQAPGNGGGSAAPVIEPARTIDAAVRAVDATTTLLDAGTTDAPTAIDASVVKRSAGKPCYVGGCGGELCSDEQNRPSTCEEKPFQQCYPKSRCERQPDGKCGWTHTPAFDKCMSDGSFAP